MTIRITKLWLIEISVLVLLSGCASTPDTDSDTVAHKGLNDDSLDVLFATEFPVESEEDALTRAEQAIEEGQIDKALFYFVRALQFRPDNVELLVRIAEIRAGSSAEEKNDNPIQETVAYRN